MFLGIIVCSDSIESACNAEDLGSTPGLGGSPGEGNATHSSILAWKNPWTAEPGGLQSVKFSYSAVSDSLQPHEPQHTRPPWPSPTTGVHPNPCPLSQWCHPTISSSVVPFSSCPQSFPAFRVISNESALRIRWPKYWSFSFNSFSLFFIQPNISHDVLCI